MRISLRYVLSLVVLLLVATSSVVPQARTAGAFVEVQAAPKVALLGQTVVLTGRTGYHEKKHTAGITVRHESGVPAATLTAEVSKDGAFTAAFLDTKKPGKYTVIVTAPDGKGEGRSAFKVTSLSGLADEVERAFRELDGRAGKLLKMIKETAASLPASKETAVVIKEIDDIEVRQRTVDLPPVEIIGELRRVVHGPTVIFLPEQKIFGELQEWIGEVEETTGDIDRSGVLDRSRDSICETINTAIEGCRFAAVAFNLGKTGLETLKKVFIDKAIPSVVTAAMGDNAAALGVSSGLKASAARLDGKISLQNSIPGILLDAVEFGIKELYKLYCGTYQTPIKVKMTMVWNEGAQPWMRYSIDLEGRMALRFPLKSAPGQPIPMTGDIEGNAVKHEFWEDVFVVEPMPRSIMLLNRAWLPPPAFPNAVESPVDTGSILRLVTPASFNIPLVAELAGDTIKMQFKPARMDFSALMIHRKLFVVFNGLMPDFTVMTVPIQSAFWILSKGFGDPWVAEVQKDASGKRFIAKTFTAHRETADKGVVVDWQISLDTRKTRVKELGVN